MKYIAFLKMFSSQLHMNALSYNLKFSLKSHENRNWNMTSENILHYCAAILAQLFYTPKVQRMVNAKIDCNYPNKTLAVTFLINHLLSYHNVTNE